MAKLLEFKRGAARMSEYESGAREPDLLVLLRYARLAKVSVESLIDDKLDPRLSPSNLATAFVSLGIVVEVQNSHFPRISQ
jgi:transcriptional regulator with XRE-family HTH domain